jgi:uncharacterized protein YeaO (DUF488 family)
LCPIIADGLHRIYDQPEPGDGARLLVDRLWPRGVDKEAAKLDDWYKDAALSDELRKWFGHDPERWPEFKRRYFVELERNPASWQDVLRAAASGKVTLLYGAHDREHNNAVALREYLEARLGRRGD